MNKILSKNQEVRVFLHDPKEEESPSYIEGIIENVDKKNGSYTVMITYDSAFDSNSFDNEPGLKALTRKGESIKVPIAPEQGDFSGRIEKI
tara:strand:+ start:356 stop:628 length:273 start_codon:yes stop_codon:yes gene_type:complete